MACAECVDEIHSLWRGPAAQIRPTLLSHHRAADRTWRHRECGKAKPARVTGLLRSFMRSVASPANSTCRELCCPPMVTRWHRIGRAALSCPTCRRLSWPTFLGGLSAIHRRILTVASLLFAEPRRLGNHTRAALPDEITPQPLVLDPLATINAGALPNTAGVPFTQQGWLPLGCPSRPRG